MASLIIAQHECTTATARCTSDGQWAIHVQGPNKQQMQDFSEVQKVFVRLFLQMLDFSEAKTPLTSEKSRICSQ